MLYQLLRNNTITGPFTKETLLQQGFLPADMVKTIADDVWKYPSDIEDFKDVSENISKPKFKITATKEVMEINNKQELKEPETPAKSPFKRMPSAAPKKPAQTDKKDFQAKSPIRDTDETPNYKKTAYQTAYENSDEKRSSNWLKELLLPLLIIGAIGVLGWYGYEKFFVNHPNDNAAAPLQDTATIANTPPDTARAIALPVKPLTDSIKKDSVKLPPQKDSLPALQKIDSSRIKQDTADRAVKQEATPIPPKTETPVVKNTPPEFRKKSIDDYIALSLNKNPNNKIKGIKLMVKNIGGEPLNIAVINVSYLDNKGKFVKNETLEVDNIGVGKTVSAKIPDSENAAKIICKTSLISGDNIYLMRK